MVLKCEQKWYFWTWITSLWTYTQICRRIMISYIDTYMCVCTQNIGRMVCSIFGVHFWDDVIHIQNWHVRHYIGCSITRVSFGLSAYPFLYSVWVTKKHSLWKWSFSLAKCDFLHHNKLFLFMPPKSQGAVSIRKTVLPGMAIPMFKIRRPNGRLIFNMEIAIRR